MLELGGGWWIEPAVLTGVDHSMRIMKKETFGPIMPAMGYSTVDEARGRVEAAAPSETTHRMLYGYPFC